MTAETKKKLFVLSAVGLMLAVLVVPVSIALAGETAPATSTAPAATPTTPTAPAGGTGEIKGGQWGWKQVIMAMGSCGIVIVLLSVAGLALVIQYGVELRHDKMIPPHILSEIEQLFEQEQYEQAIELCESDDSFFSRIFGAGLAKMGSGYGRMVEAIQEATEEEVTSWYHKIGWLSLIGTVAPMLGLLGTVIGMIEGFSVIASKGGAANPAELAESISKALVTTYEGLVVAMPVLTAYQFFKNKIGRLTLELGVVAGDLLDRFRPVQ